MAKRLKWLTRKDGVAPGYLLNTKMSGRGTPDSVVEWAFWLGAETGHLDPWVRALEAIDKRGGKNPLLVLLKSDLELPLEARIFIADLLARYQLKKKRGGQSTPAYDRTEADARLEWANMFAVGLIERGVSVRDACGKAAAKFGIPEGLLADFHAGRRGGSTRMKNRRK